MSWIHTIPYTEADAALKKIYDRIKGSDDNVDNVLLIHSLRPHTLKGHMALYKSVLHNSQNQLPKWYLEAVGTYVSHLNACDYCFDHHYAGLSRLLKEQGAAERCKKAILEGALDDYFEGPYLLGCQYARLLTLEHRTITKEHIDEMRAGGFSDGEILELNQLVSYFNYVNRTVLGLGVTTEGDVLGLSPNDSNDPNNWSHH
ncbi:MAG: alkylhydroperoxidase [Bacteroidota bacterium]